MPLFVYECLECEHQQEALRRIKDTYKSMWCEKCGGAMRNIIARPARMVRGAGGWSSPAPKG